MKINKKALTESALHEDDILDSEVVAPEDIKEDDVIIDDVNAASTDEIADAVQDAAVAAEQQPVSDKQATEIAQEIKTYAKGIKYASWAPLEFENALTKKLDKCLAMTFKSRLNKTNSAANILITGLPGSGKTTIVEQWAEARGVVLCPVMAGDKDLDAVLNGFAVDDVTHNDDGSNNHKLVRSRSSELENLEKERSVLFLDEFNRADYSTRGLLLGLINHHRVLGKDFPNMLFTIACINPAIDSDPGATPLVDAEKSRFVAHKRWDSTPENGLKYLRSYLKNVLDNTDPSVDDYEELYTQNAFALALAIKLLGDPRFRFDDDSDLQMLADEHAVMLNQRMITNAILNSSDKESFLDWVDDDSGILPKNKKIIHDILDGWQPPRVVVPGVRGGDTTADALAAEGQDSKTDSDATSGDFNAVFGGGGQETDTSLFGGSGTLTDAQKAHRVTAADAINRIKSFNF